MKRREADCALTNLDLPILSSETIEDNRFTL